MIIRAQENRPTTYISPEAMAYIQNEKKAKESFSRNRKKRKKRTRPQKRRK